MLLVQDYGETMELRYGTTKDAQTLSELGARTFFDAFAKLNTAENINSYLEKSFSPDIQRKELSSPDVIFILADLKGTSIGYAQLLIGSSDESISGIKPMELRRIYADQNYIGKGIGGQLMQAAIDESRLRGCDCIWLGVWEKNSRAIAFYEKWMFRKVGAHLFMLGNEPQNDYIMELKI